MIFAWFSEPQLHVRKDRSKRVRDVQRQSTCEFKHSHPVTPGLIDLSTSLVLVLHFKHFESFTPRNNPSTADLTLIVVDISHYSELC